MLRSDKAGARKGKSDVATSKKRNLTVMDHPLVAHKLAILRDRTTPSHRFRHTLHELSWLLAHPTFAALELGEVDIETPIEPMRTFCMQNPYPCLVSILRAGNGLIDGFSQVCPEASVGHLGLYRDHATMAPVSYYSSLPADIAKRQVILGDPMLATGGSAVMAIDKLREMGVDDIVFSCLVAAPQGVKALHDAHPEIHVITAAMDRDLNDKCYIVPGLGDAGDRIYGTG